MCVRCCQIAVLHCPPNRHNVPHEIYTRQKARLCSGPRRVDVRWAPNICQTECVRRPPVSAGACCLTQILAHITQSVSPEDCLFVARMCEKTQISTEQILAHTARFIRVSICSERATTSCRCWQARLHLADRRLYSATRERRKPLDRSAVPANFGNAKTKIEIVDTVGNYSTEALCGCCGSRDRRAPGFRPRGYWGSRNANGTLGDSEGIAQTARKKCRRPVYGFREPGTLRNPMWSLPSQVTIAFVSAQESVDPAIHRDSEGKTLGNEKMST